VIKLEILDKIVILFNDLTVVIAKSKEQRAWQQAILLYAKTI